MEKFDSLIHSVRFPLALRGMPFASVKVLNSQTAAEEAVAAIGCGYDLNVDLRLTSRKVVPGGSGGGKVIVIDETLTRDLAFPGRVVVPGVPASIKWDKGERTRFCSDVLTFNQMSELFNREFSLSGKIPSEHFNRMFNFKGSWQKDAAVTKTLSLDGWHITLYSVELEKSHITLSDYVKREIPVSWDPSALAAFIEKYGTHVIVGVKMGGKDVIHLKQLHTSNLTPTELQKLLKKLGDDRFSANFEGSTASKSTAQSAKLKDKNRSDWDVRVALANSFRPSVNYHSKNEDVLSINVRRGGVDLGDHESWLSTISESPNVVSMSFVPINSLFNGVQGCGFLSHAVNLYLRYKPPIEELAEFLEFQLPREWAPQYSDLPLGLRRKRDVYPSITYSFTGPKLYVNTVKVDTGNRPVTGIRLFLEGKKCNQLAVHLQHLSSLPKILLLNNDFHHHYPDDRRHAIMEKEYYQPIKWSIFSHVCTSPVEHLDELEPATVVTKAWFEVKPVGMKKVLFLRLGFSTVSSSRIRKSEWDGPSSSSMKSGLFSNLISGRFSSGLAPGATKEPEKPDINSGVYPGRPPVASSSRKLSNIVDVKEMVRGPEDHPGYWVVTGAKLSTENGKVGVKVKYSLLTILSEEDDPDLISESARMHL